MSLLSIASADPSPLLLAQGGAAAAAGGTAWWVIAILVVVGLIGLFVLFVLSQVIQLWLQALLSGAKVALLDLLMMRFRKVRPDVIVINRISAKKAGLDLPTNMLEAHYLAGGNVSRVVRAMIADGRSVSAFASHRAWSMATTSCPSISTACQPHAAYLARRSRTSMTSRIRPSIWMSLKSTITVRFERP